MGSEIGQTWKLFDVLFKASKLQPLEDKAFYEVHFEETAGNDTIH